MIGTAISHYSLLKKLGSGGMGEVYEAEDLKLQRRVALKFLPENLAHDPHALERFQREALALSALNHPNICTIHEIDESGGTLFMAMELLEGGPLHQMIAGKPLTLDMVLTLGAEIADALEAAHSHASSIATSNRRIFSSLAATKRRSWTLAWPSCYPGRHRGRRTQLAPLLRLSC